MRVSVILDDDLLERAKALTGITTTREVLQLALEELVRLREQGQVRELRGKLTWEGNLDMMREGRHLDRC